MALPRVIMILCLLFLCLVNWVGESKNLKIMIDGNIYTLLYEPRKVKFSDLDILKIMFHSNQIKHCGNSVICYLLKMSALDAQQLNYVVRHIDITYNKPLKYENIYKIIGGVTNYGNTSMQITLYGVGTDETTKTGSEAENGDHENGDNKMGINLLHDMTSNEKNRKKQKKIDKLLNQMGDENEIININDNLFQETEFQKKCINYFTVIYTLVKIDDKGHKSIIDEAFKQEHKTIDVEKLKHLVNIFC
ncbi:hypothetical protein PGO_093200 [Plasmodium gonderi]|uniref:Uncharacterized protein n=1 Tax=Plasmodium gonderi TaxID=77519 RepID=A0A1Y1JFT6_PLAGO|nr:hypothetical protein PGO_093200 [Plasmodium gonderi]GAW81120.1 hypothetical protein PGO_093200 [Plasmodium gonderi]